MDRLVTVLLGSLLASVAYGYPLHPPPTPSAPITPSIEDRREVEFGGPVLGVQATELTPELQQHFGTDELGVLISRVYDDTAADDAGIQVGDVLVSVDGNPISSIWELRAAVDEANGRDVIVEVVRDGQMLQLPAQLASMAPAAFDEPENFVEVPSDAFVLDDEDLERYLGQWSDHEQDHWRARQEGERARLDRMQKQFDELQLRLQSELEEIQDRLEALEKNDFGNSDVR